MCPPARVDITEFWTDEDVIKSLKDIKSGSPLPENVIADVDPYQISPSNLPEGIWFFCSVVNKKSKHGFWKATGEACDIYSNRSSTGWRTTLEYYEGQSPHEQRTNWIMQEYWITEKELRQNIEPKVSGVLCRVFMSDAKSSSQELLHQHGLVDMSNTVKNVSTTDPNAGSNTGQISKRKSLCLNITGTSPNEDFLELNDLRDDPSSNSSSSVNSSFRTINSEDYFNPDALLREIEQDNKDQQKKSSSFEYIDSSKITPTEVFLQPAIVGSIISGNGSKSPTEVTRIKDHSNEEGTSNAPEMVSSSSSSQSSNGSLKEKKKGIVGKMKKIKYLCFISF